MWVLSHTFKVATVISESFTDDKSAPITFKEKLNICRFLDRLVVLEPDYLLVSSTK
jgi:hypothetical protein